MMCYLLTTATVLFCVGKIIHLQITDSIHTILFVVFFVFCFIVTSFTAILIQRKLVGLVIIHSDVSD